MAGGAARVLVVSVEPTDQQPAGEAGQVGGEEETGGEREEGGPDPRDEDQLAGELRAPSPPRLHSRVVGQVAGSPERLRDPQERREVEREQQIQGAQGKERLMEEVVRDRGRVPPS